MSTVNGFQVGNEVLKYNYESLENYNTPNFSTSSSTQYAVGDYVTYQGKLYKCTTATTGGTWVSGSWELAILSDDLQSLGSEVEDLNRQLSDVESAINSNDQNILIDVEWEIGSINYNGANTDDNRRIRTKSFINVETYDEIRILIDSGYKYGVLWYSENGTCIENSGFIAFDTTFSAPSNGTKIRLVVSDTQDGQASLTYANSISVLGVSHVAKLYESISDSSLFKFVPGAKTAGGGDSTDTTYLKSRRKSQKVFVPSRSIISIDNPSVYAMCVFQYSPTGEYVSATQYLDGGIYECIFDRYIVLQIKKVDGTNFTDNETVTATITYRDAVSNLVNGRVNYLDEQLSTIGTSENQFAWLIGSLNSLGQEIEANNRIRSTFIDLTDALLVVKSNEQKVAYCLYDENYNSLVNSGWKQCDFSVKIVKNAKYARFVVANVTDTQLVPSDLVVEIIKYTGMQVKDVEAESPINGFTETPFSQTIKVINHRGYNSIAPENTIPAFKLSRQMGFSAIETDIQLTSDNVPVVLHDATVNRTSNGTGNIYDMTLAQAEALDFGSWKSSMYAGTKIPTFEEMLLCCKKIGLDVYIEIKSESPWTQEIITGCVQTVRECGMRDHVTWISFSDTLLGYVKNADSKARLGFLMTTYNNGAVNTCVSLKTADNEVLAVTRYDLLPDSVLAYMIEKDIPLCGYLFDKCSDGDAMQSYVTEALTNEFNVAKYIYEKNIE